MKKWEYILVLGSNLGDRKKNLEEAISLLSLSSYIEIQKKTPPIETPPEEYHRQNPFLNQALLIKSPLAPHKLLEVIEKIEKELGKEKFSPKGARKIDMDIVKWEDWCFFSSSLRIPHIKNFSRYWVRHLISLLENEEKEERIMPIRSAKDFLQKKEKKEKIAILTCYDYTMAKLLSRTSLDAVLVGDSLNQVIRGEKNTLSVKLEYMIYHAKAVKKALPDTFVIVDMPFLSYPSKEKALENAGKILQETGADAVKIEGGSKEIIEIVAYLSSYGIPVMGHLGFTPQWVLQKGIRVAGKSPEEKEDLLKASYEIEEAGAFALVLELVSSSLAGKISQKLKIPVIGIGAGKEVDGQVLVLYDLLNLDPEFQPRFVRHYANFSEELIHAVEEFAKDVREGEFPSSEESYE